MFIPFFPISTSLIEAVSVQHEWSGSSPPPALEFTTYGQVFRMKTSNKSTTLVCYFSTRHFPHLHVHKRRVCGGARAHTHSSFTECAAVSSKRLSLWLILSLPCWYQRGGTECKKDDWRQECFERGKTLSFFLQLHAGFRMSFQEPNSVISVDCLGGVLGVLLTRFLTSVVPKFSTFRDKYIYFGEQDDWQEWCQGSNMIPSFDAKYSF